MTNDKVNDMCDKAITIINDCHIANFISNEIKDTFTSDILKLKNNQNRILATELCETHENNMKQYL